MEEIIVKIKKYIGLGGIFLTLNLMGCELTPATKTKEVTSAEESSYNSSTEKNNNELEKPSETNNSTISTAGTTEQIPVELVKVVDGDTIRVIFNGENVSVRYLLMDTPETSHPKLGEQPFGKEAKEQNAELLNGGNVTLELDVGERFDKYQRLLAYVYVDGVSVQEKLIEEGLARVAYVYPPNTRYLTAYETAQERAKEKKLGIWSSDEYVTPSGFDSSIIEAEGNGTENTSIDAEPVENPAGEENYKNCTELRKVHPNGVPQDHPAYEKKHDRDDDGWACER